MKNFKIIALVLLATCLAFEAYSQGNVSICFGPSVPVSDFGSDDLYEEGAGGASVGLNVGLKYVYPLSESGLGIFVGIDFNYNGLKKDFKDDAEELYENMGLVDPEVDYYEYINLPITTGLNYIYQAEDKIGVFANAGLALNFLKMTNLVVEANGQKSITKMDLASSFGFKIGGGILINQITSVSIDYFGLGEHDLDGKAATSDFSIEFNEEKKVDLLTFTLGFRF